MPLSWNEIRHNAIRFARDWAAKSESADALAFWREFFAVFGLPRRTVAFFEGSVGCLAGTYDCIDLFWFRMLLVEHKSLGHDLGLDESQSYRYICDLVSAGKEDHVPRYVISSDFARISLLDLEPEDPEKRTIPGGYRIEFPLGELHRHIRAFAFILGDQQDRLEDHPEAHRKHELSAATSRRVSRDRAKALERDHALLLFSLAEPESLDSPPPQAVKEKKGEAKRG